MSFQRTVVAAFLTIALVGSLAAQETEPNQETLSAALIPVKTSPDPAWLLAGARESAERAAAHSPRKALWKASLVALVASSALDAHSSWGKREANPLLANSSGRFGVQGIALKGIIAGGAVGAQWFLLRHNPSSRRIATVANFAMAGIYTRVAVHNYGNSR